MRPCLPSLGTPPRLTRRTALIMPRHPTAQLHPTEATKRAKTFGAPRPQATVERLAFLAGGIAEVQPMLLVAQQY